MCVCVSNYLMCVSMSLSLLRDDIWQCECVHRCLRAWVCMCCMCVFVCACMCVCVYACMCVCVSNHLMRTCMCLSLLRHDIWQRSVHKQFRAWVCVRVCVRETTSSSWIVHLYTQIHAYMLWITYKYKYIQIHTNTYKYIQIHTNTCIHVKNHSHIHIHTYIIRMHVVHTL